MTDGKWELVDGLQRISTVLEFSGKLRDPETKARLRPSILQSTKYLPSLNGTVWEDDGLFDEPVTGIGREFQRSIRTSRIQVEILKRPSDINTKFELFQRLNRGGETANAQEVRNCLCVMLEPALYRLTRELSSYNSYTRVTQLTDTARQQQRDLEWTMRILVHTYVDYDNKRDVENFIDDGLKDLAQRDRRELERKFKQTFDLLFRAGGDDALKPMDDEGRLANRVTLRQIEAIAVGIARNLDNIERLSDPVAFVTEKVKSFWQQRAEVDQMSAPGLRGTQRLLRTIPFGQRWFRPN